MVQFFFRTCDWQYKETTNESIQKALTTIPNTIKSISALYFNPFNHNDNPFN